MASARKPYNDRAGYIASRRNHTKRDFVVLYIAEKQNIESGEKYAVVCEEHGEILGSTSVPNGRLSMKDTTGFCQGCRDNVIVD